MTEIQIRGYAASDMDVKAFVLDWTPTLPDSETEQAVPDPIGLAIAGYAAQDVASDALEALVSNKPVRIEAVAAAVEKATAMHVAAATNGARGASWTARELGVLSQWVQQITPPEPHVDPIRVTARVGLEFTAEFLSDVLTTAIAGGMSHWAEVYETEKGRDKYGAELYTSVRLSAKEDTSTVHTVTLETVAVGLMRVLDGNMVPIVGQDARVNRRTTIAEHIIDADAGMIDAGEADTIVQLGLFGEEVY